MFSFWVSSWWLPVSDPNRLCQEHVRLRSYSKRLLMDGYTSTASGGNRRIGALKQNKGLLRSGLNAKRQRDVPTHVGAVVTVSAGDFHTYAVRPDGQLVCFGNDADGQCDVPTDLGAVVAVSAGHRHTCAVRSDGQRVCFGLNDFGQCDVPTDLGAVLAVSAGVYHTCAVGSDGQLVCFGLNDFGQCDVPTDLAAVLAVSAGVYHTCAVRSDGQLACFGMKDYGQCDVPTDLGAVLAVSAGFGHTCAVRSDGQLVCFGDNADGQCDVPTDLGAVVAVSAGVYHTCAVRSDGQLVCFGLNAYGQCDVPRSAGQLVFFRWNAQAHQPWRTSLATLPHLSEKSLKVLRDYSVDSLPELIERRDANKLLTKLSLPSADAHKELLQIVQDMPRFLLTDHEDTAVTFACQKVLGQGNHLSSNLKGYEHGTILHRSALQVKDANKPAEEEEEAKDGKPKRRKGKLVAAPYKVPPDSELELTVILCYDNEPMKFVHAPRFPKKKTYSWWCILGDTEVDELVSIKKALMPTRQRFEKRISFQFCSPADEIGETFTLSVLCMSDSFFGLDQQLDLSITTVEPQGEA
ncbi:Ultraviolet-B receptor UVR8 [Symbiodinium microadriaticum]|uniref:Ultraviolet-B receptor UVR8 n=1 Tax=Symbiodinium microadriaticum TaxID=2951 RepID=A0A1Q9CLP5_SYMMI|nr:Ultraviolet-B receptor UVR8 [Symbiodinium microadriaticum]